MAPKGPVNLKVLATALADATSALLGQMRETGAIYLDQIATFKKVIVRLANELKPISKKDDQMRRLCTTPGNRPVKAGAVAALKASTHQFSSVSAS